MILKIIGAAFIISAAYLYGVQLSSRYRNRVNNLESLLVSLEMVHAEINHGLTPLPQAFARAGKNISNPMGNIFLDAAKEMESCRGLSAQKCWVEAVQKYNNELDLTERQLNEINRLSVIWGKGDKAGQLKQIALIQDFIRHALEKARLELDRNDKLWRYLGLLGGVTLSLMLL